MVYVLGACVVAVAEAEVREAEDEDEREEADEADAELAELADALALALALEAEALAEELMLALAEEAVFEAELVCTSLAPEIWNPLEKLMTLGSLVSTMAKFHCPLLISLGMVKVAVSADAATVATSKVSSVPEGSLGRTHSNQCLHLAQ